MVRDLSDSVLRHAVSDPKINGKRIFVFIIGGMTRSEVSTGWPLLGLDKSCTYLWSFGFVLPSGFKKRNSLWVLTCSYE